MSKQPIVALVDGDYLEYAAGFAGQHTYYAALAKDDNGFTTEVLDTFEDKQALNAFLAETDEECSIWERTEVEPVENVLHSCKLMLQKIEEQVARKFERDVDMRLYLTGSGNFRERIATIRPYKGTRKPWHKPRLQPDIRQYMVEHWGAEIIYGQEADDEVCILQTQLAKEGQPSVICGIDKDLLQCPGWHFDANKQRFAKISPAQGDVLFYKQVLTGDTVDNIAGCYKCGAKAASDVMQEAKAELKSSGLAGRRLRRWLYEAAVRKYQESIERYGEKTGYAHMTAEEAVLENGQLVWMRREREQMWEPPK